MVRKKYGKYYSWVSPFSIQYFVHFHPYKPFLFLSYPSIVFCLHELHLFLWGDSISSIQLQFSQFSSSFFSWLIHFYFTYLFCNLILIHYLYMTLLLQRFSHIGHSFWIEFILKIIIIYFRKYLNIYLLNTRPK